MENNIDQLENNINWIDQLENNINWIDQLENNINWIDQLENNRSDNKNMVEQSHLTPSAALQCEPLLVVVRSACHLCHDASG